MELRLVMITRGSHANHYVSISQAKQSTKVETKSTMTVVIVQQNE